MGDANLSSIPVLPSPSNVGVAKAPEETNEWPQRLKDAKDRKATYHEYLASAEWQAKRVGALERAGSRCQVCNYASDLRVHHRTYERIGDEAPDDLTVLCVKCHDLFHGTSTLTRTPQRLRKHRSSRAGHHPCSRCGRNWTSKAMCRPCRKKGRRANKRTEGKLRSRPSVTQADIERLAGAMNGKWKSTARRERQQASLAESKRNGAVQARPKPSLRNMRPSGGRGAS